MKASCNGLLLKAIWSFSVNQGESYRLPEQEDVEGSYILISCRQGEGQIETATDNHTINEGEVLLLPRDSFNAYQSVTEKWQCWWVEFNSIGRDQLCSNGPELFQKLKLTDGDFESIQQNFRKRTVYHRGLAAASFNHMLYRWQSNLEEVQLENVHQESVNKVINEMYKRASDCWSLKDMSSFAGMGEENFRKVFSKLTGCSPKKFYNNLRLSMAEALLRRGPYSVAEVADLFNFTDAFHFSKSFKKHFNFSPSKIKVRKSARRQLVS